jgi:hypothetical protein
MVGIGRERTITSLGLDGDVMKIKDKIASSRLSDHFRHDALSKCRFRLKPAGFSTTMSASVPI